MFKLVVPRVAFTSYLPTTRIQIATRFSSIKLLRTVHTNIPKDSNQKVSWKTLIGDGSYQGTYPSRTHSCGELRAEHDGHRVILCGWAQSIRTLSSDLVFVPIKDSSGTTQLVYRVASNEDALHNSDLKETLQLLKVESVICAEGVVKRRPIDMINKKMTTGEIEVEIKHLYCLNPAIKLPFQPLGLNLPNEEIRLKHRYLDLRRDVLQQNLRMRSLAAFTAREFLTQRGFIEVETPLLFKSTPEGAREFIVPTRNKGLFFALPQSPQQHKQMLMAAGVDKYFQIARCFRDEDLRADRQPEFTQIDLEMAFVTMKDIQEIIEGLIKAMWEKVLGIKLGDESFQKITYAEAMSKYGSDKPDTRYEMMINDISEHFPDLANAESSIIECLVARRGASLTASELKALEVDIDGNTHKQALNFIKINENNHQIWLSKTFLTRGYSDLSSIQNQLNMQLNINIGDLVVMTQRPKFLTGSSTFLGRIRIGISEIMNSRGILHILSTQYKFLWVESFPLFMIEDSHSIDRRFSSTHHPFTAPMVEDMHLLEEKPELVRGQHYDLVVNGVEVGGGSIRIHSPALQIFVLEKILKLTENERLNFGHLIEALSSGCPPHGGLALGFDRLMAIMCGVSSIRDVIAFPKAAGGKDYVAGSPSTIRNAQLAEYGLKLL